MYITGTVLDFASRMHQLTSMNIPTGAVVASGLVSINQFLIEGRTYINSNLATGQTSGRWEQEARKQRWLLSGDAQAMLTQMF
jgi:hypothetical protein